MNRILVPLDGSPLARWALPWALSIRSALRGEVALVGVHSPLELDAGPAAEGLWDTEMRAAEQAGLDAEAARLADAGHPRPATQLVDGLPGPAIVEAAEQLDAGLIVMATHGRGGLSRAWLGSVASFVVRHAHAPVLVVHPVDDGSHPDLRALPQIDTLLVALDGSAFAEAAGEAARTLANAFGATLSFVRAAPAPLVVGSPYIPPAGRAGLVERDERIAAAERYLRRAATELAGDAPARWRVDETEPPHAIPAAAREEGADMIVMATHGRSALMRAMVGSVADKVMRTATVPVLLVRPTEAVVSSGARGWRQHVNEGLSPGVRNA